MVPVMGELRGGGNNEAGFDCAVVILCEHLVGKRLLGLIPVVIALCLLLIISILNHTTQYVFAFEFHGTEQSWKSRASIFHDLISDTDSAIFPSAKSAPGLGRHPNPVPETRASERV